MPNCAMLAKEILESLREQPAPPIKLYKFLSPERIDVLLKRKIRFSPLYGTNDVFEVRRRFIKVFGQKMDVLIEHYINEIDIDEYAANSISKEFNLEIGKARVMAQELLTGKLGSNYKIRIMDRLKEEFLPPLLYLANSDEFINKFIYDTFHDLLALSLAEDVHSRPMWAHYAARGSGFVVEFNTADAFFSAKNSPGRKRLMKVSYGDENLGELIDDPYAVICSKSSEWVYEKEWRIHSKPDEADQTFELESGELAHLFSFPTSAVSSVIVGYDATAEFERQLDDVAAANFPGACLRRLVPLHPHGRFEDRELRGGSENCSS